MGLPLCEAKRHHTSTTLNRNFIIQEKSDRFSNCWFGSLGFCCNKIWTHKPQTDHKVQVKGIMVVCYFGMVFNRSSQLDRWSLCGSPPFVKPKGITNQQFLIGTLYKKKMIDFQIVGLEAWDSVATRSEHTNLKQITRYRLRGSWWIAILGLSSIDLHN